MNNQEPTIRRRYWPNGQIKEEWQEVNGLKEGWRRFYLENGRLFSEMEFQHGVGDGAIREWNDEGTKILEATLKDGEYHGHFKAWWRNGLLKEDGIFNKGKHAKGYRYYTDEGELWRELQGDDSGSPPFSGSDIQ
jgi:antitoxin component YwqK of YwqJK toxin-antitoxin module